MTVGVALTGAIVDVTQTVGWRYVFYAGSADRRASRSPSRFVALKESPKNLKMKTDWLGAIFFAGALGAALVALTAYSSNGLTPISIVHPEHLHPIPALLPLPERSDTRYPSTDIAVVGVVSTALFVVREMTTSQPVINFHTFRTNSMFASTNFSALFLYMAHYGTLILLSFYLEHHPAGQPAHRRPPPDGRAALRDDLRAVRRMDREQDVQPGPGGRWAGDSDRLPRPPEHPHRDDLDHHDRLPPRDARGGGGDIRPHQHQRQPRLGPSGRPRVRQRDPRG